MASVAGRSRIAKRTRQSIDKPSGGMRNFPNRVICPRKPESGGKMFDGLSDRRIDRYFPAVIVLYFSIQLAMRLSIGPTLELDEAETFWQSQTLDFGYGPQPPLYNWIQWGFSELFGRNLFSVAALKASILSATLFCIFRFLRGSGIAAAAACIGTLSLGLMPDILWESQRALTHSVLAVCLSAVALLTFLRVAQHGRRIDYLVFGAVLGLGVISKFNFVFLIGGLVGAAILLKDLRTSINPQRLVLTAIVAISVASPALYFYATLMKGTMGSVHKLSIVSDRSFANFLHLSGDFADALAGVYALPGAVLLGFAFARRKWSSSQPIMKPELLRWTALIAILLALILSVAVNATEFKGRWFVPFSWPLVVYFTVIVWANLHSGGQGRLSFLLCSLWALAVIALPYASLVSPGYRNADFSRVLSHIRPGDVVASDSIWLLGNLSLKNGKMNVLQFVGHDAPVADIELLGVADDAPGVTVAGLGFTQGAMVAVPYGNGEKRFVVRRMVRQPLPLD
ncbi:glycosyltransferase family 39 protein [Paracoccaceae bacterium Fryx2]|nr:glycosyltransferase family 39 protein [Paracoccaceae bacterium Fryx2]